MAPSVRQTQLDAPLVPVIWKQEWAVGGQGGGGLECFEGGIRGVLGDGGVDAVTLPKNAP